MSRAMEMGRILDISALLLLVVYSRLLIKMTDAAIVPKMTPQYPFFSRHLPLNPNSDAFKVFYEIGATEEDLPICGPSTVCNKVDVYDIPWVQRQCRCPGQGHCSASLDENDGYTVTDKTRQFKMCEPVKKLPKCRYFRDVTWTYVTYPNNVTQQVLHCVCPSKSVAYIVKRKAFDAFGQVGFRYSFACSPQTRLRCQRKEPCRLFTVRKKERHHEVNTNTLCQCPHNHNCPKHHKDTGVIPGKSYTDDGIRTFSGYCMMQLRQSVDLKSTSIKKRTNV